MPSPLDSTPAIIKGHTCHFITSPATNEQRFPSKSEFHVFAIIHTT